jgi:type II secretory pathway pseudopilin PulG
MNRIKNADGFTLPEILIAGSLFALAVIAVTSSMRVSLVIERGTDLKRQAAIKLRSAIDSTRVWSPIPVFGVCRLTLGGSADPTIPCNIRVVSSGPEPGFDGRNYVYPTPHRIVVRISWETDSLSHEIYDPRLL